MAAESFFYFKKLFRNDIIKLYFDRKHLITTILFPCDKNLG